MATCYLMLKDDEDDVIQWACQWGTEDNSPPDEPTEAQFAMKQFIEVLVRMSNAEA